MVMADERLLTVAQVADRLQVSEYTVREWLRTGRLRGHRLGGDKLGWRVRPSDLTQFIDAAANDRGEQPGEGRGR